MPHVDAYILRMALDREQLTDFAYREAELLGFLNKLQVGEFPFLIKAVPSLRPR